MKKVQKNVKRCCEMENWIFILQQRSHRNGRKSLFFRDDIQNRLSVDIVLGVTLGLKMGINHKASHDFVSLWKKTLSKVSENKSDELVQGYLNNTYVPNLPAYMFDHPMYLVVFIGFLFFVLLIVVLYIESTRAKNKQLQISEQLSDALIEAKQHENIVASGRKKTADTDSFFRF